MQHLPTRDQHFEMRADGEQVSYVHSCTYHLLKVVEQQQHLPLTEKDLKLFEQRPLSRFPQTKRLGDGRDDQVGIADGGQRHEPDPVGEVRTQLLGHVQCHAGFAHASRTRQRDEAHVLTQEQVVGGIHFLLPSNERSGLDGQVGRKVGRLRHFPSFSRPIFSGTSFCASFLRGVPLVDEH